MKKTENTNATIERLERENERINCLLDELRSKIESYSYNYEHAVYTDAKAEIEEMLKNGEIVLSDYTSRPDDFEEDIYDRLWICDSVTGNGSGSYTFNTYRAEMYLAHNWDLLQEALDEFGVNGEDILEHGPEWCDVTIRCHLLRNAIAQIVDDMDNEGAFDPEDEDESDEMAAEE